MERDEASSRPPWWFRPLIYGAAALAGIVMASIAVEA